MRWQVSKYLLILFLAMTFAQSTYANAQDASYANDYAAAKKLQQALRHNDRRAVANLIQYPLLRDQPLASIKNSADFLKHWDEYFNSANMAFVSMAKPKQYGWRGIAMADGMVWFRDGHIITINLQTAVYKAVLTAAIDVESRGLYASARGYDKIIFQCKTKNLYIRVQQYADSLKYFAWKITTPLSSKPELEITGGKYLAQGTGGNFDIEFQNNGFTYSLNVGHNLCGEDCNDYLAVSQGDKQLSNEVCTEVSE